MYSISDFSTEFGIPIKTAKKGTVSAIIERCCNKDAKDYINRWLKNKKFDAVLYNENSNWLLIKDTDGHVHSFSSKYDCSTTGFGDLNYIRNLYYTFPKTSRIKRIIIEG